MIGVAGRDIGSMDPAFTRGNVDEFVVRQIFNPLISPPPGTLTTDLDRVQGEIAESWTVSPDAQAWTFKIREGVMWQKGYGEVTAEDVKFSFERQTDPETDAIYASSYEIIESIDVVDRYTVRFNLRQPNAFLHATSLMPRFGAYIVPKAAVEELGEDFGLKPVGSGPYELVSYDPKGGVELKANADYFEGAPGIGNVSIKLMPETSARTLAFIGGDLDIIEGARSPGWTEDLQKQAPEAIFDAMQPGSTQTMFINLTKPPFDNLKVRQAIAHALDQRVWAKAFGVLSGKLWGPAPSEFYGGLSSDDLPEELRYAYDPERAKALLAEAGFPEGFAADVFISEREDYRSNMLLVQDQLRDVGIQLNLRVVDHSSYHADIRKDLNPLIVYSTSQPPIVVPFLQAFYASDAIVTKPTANRNFSHYGDQVGSIDEMMATAISEPDAAKQRQMLHDIQIQIMRDLPVVPLQTLAVLYVRQPSLDLGFDVDAGLGNYTLSKAKFVE
jgi:peptide/nickel transport system substrate-binding protein